MAELRDLYKSQYKKKPRIFVLIQYVVAKYALGVQLYHLGYVPDPDLDFDCDCTRMLESMYEDHGDTLALQYGGSQLIHRIKSYRKQSKWTSKASDITQVFSLITLHDLPTY